MTRLKYRMTLIFMSITILLIQHNDIADKMSSNCQQMADIADFDKTYKESDTNIEISSHGMDL